jgi:hypothetical protein
LTGLVVDRTDAVLGGISHFACYLQEVLGGGRS